MRIDAPQASIIMPSPAPTALAKSRYSVCRAQCLGKNATLDLTGARATPLLFTSQLPPPPPTLSATETNEARTCSDGKRCATFCITEQL